MSSSASGSGSAMSLPGDPPGGRRALAVWGIGVSVYFVAVIFRTSLGVAGLDAAERFHVNASALSTFSILQLLVYAGMQIPVGLLVDSLGTKKVLTIGVVLFTAGQLGFAFSPSYGTALASRALLGCGDAMTFISVLRLGTRWFPARRGPMVAQLAGLAGMAGNLVSTLVIARLLHGIGWTAAFAGSALAGVVVLVLLLLFLKDHPEGHEPAPSRTAAPPTSAARSPPPGANPAPASASGCTSPPSSPRWCSCSCGACRSWSRPRACPAPPPHELLTLVVLSNMLVGLVYGQIVARHHTARLPLALGTVGATALVWAVTLLYPGDHAPMWLLIVLCTVLGSCGPASMLGFDFARPANPPERQGTASGITNMGGFVASMTTLFLVGVLLDATGDNYSIAFSVIFLLQAIGVSQILRLRRRAARRESERLVASRVETVHVPAVTLPGWSG